MHRKFTKRHEKKLAAGVALLNLMNAATPTAQIAAIGFGGAGSPNPFLPQN